MRTLKQLSYRIGGGAAVALTNAQAALAQQRPDITNPVGEGTNFASILNTVINGLLLFAGAIAVLFLIVGGFRYVVSAGNPDQVEGAKKTILYSILGLIIIFIAFVLVRAIQNLLGVDFGELR